MADYFFDEDDSKEEIEFKDDLLNYRGYFVENDDEEEKKFYEYGAHFPYKFLYQRLEILVQERKEKQKELEKKLKEKEINNNKKSGNDQEKNEESKQKENMKDLLNIFQPKGKSRNRGDVDIGLTYMPQMNKKKEEQIQVIDEVAIGLIKSTVGHKQENKNLNKNIKNIKKNNIIKNEGLNGANRKYNNYINKNEKKSNILSSRKIKSGNKPTKIRKRNQNKIWNNNNSLNGNITISLNLFNKTKFAEKNNSKNMTHDFPFMSKITNNLVNKLKFIPYSKEKIRKHILNTGKTEQNIIKKGKQNKRNNKFRNINNKGSNSIYFGYQNTKNTSSSKNMVNNNNIKNSLINKIGISSSNNNQVNEKLDKKNKIMNKNSNLKNNIIKNNLLDNNNTNNKFIKKNNILSGLKNNNNKNKSVCGVNKNMAKKSNITSKNNISINSINKNSNNIENEKNKIQSINFKNMLLKKDNCISSNGNKNQFEFIDSFGTKINKNNISRNNKVSIFNNQIQSAANKNFHSMNNANKKIIKVIPAHVNINLTKNFNNSNQQLKTQNSKIKEINYKSNKNSSSNVNLIKYSTEKIETKKIVENNNNKKKEDQKKKNINHIQEKLKNLLKTNNMKNKTNLNKSKKLGNKSTYKNNAYIHLDSKINQKKNISRNRAENSNINLEKLTAKKNNTLTQNKKKNHININININNQQNIILNKLGNAMNNNSVNICSVRSPDIKDSNNKIENQKNDTNYLI